MVAVMGRYRGLTQDVETKLRKLQTERLEFVFGFGPQRMRPGGPKVGHGCTNRRIVDRGVGINVARILDLALDRGIDAVDFGRRERLQSGDAPFLSQGIDPCVLEQLNARVVDSRDRGIVFEVSLARQLAGEVFLGIQEFEETADGIDVFVWEVDLARLEECYLAHLVVSRAVLDGEGRPYALIFGIGKGSANIFKVRASHEEFLMRFKDCGLVFADYEGDDGALEVARKGLALFLVHRIGLCVDIFRHVHRSWGSALAALFRI